MKKLLTNSPKDGKINHTDCGGIKSAIVQYFNNTTLKIKIKQVRIFILTVEKNLISKINFLNPQYF